MQINDTSICCKNKKQRKWSNRIFIWKNIISFNNRKHSRDISNGICAYTLEGKDSKFIKYEYATYKKVFHDVKIFKVSDRDITEKQNLILIGIKGTPTINREKYTEYQKYLEKEVKEFNTDKCIVTDNYAPIGN